MQCSGPSGEDHAYRPVPVGSSGTSAGSIPRLPVLITGSTPLKGFTPCSPSCSGCHTCAVAAAHISAGGRTHPHTYARNSHAYGSSVCTGRCRAHTKCTCAWTVHGACRDLGILDIVTELPNATAERSYWRHGVPAAARIRRRFAHLGQGRRELWLTGRSRPRAAPAQASKHTRAHTLAHTLAHTHTHAPHARPHAPAVVQAHQR